MYCYFLPQQKKWIAVFAMCIGLYQCELHAQEKTDTIRKTYSIREITVTNQLNNIETTSSAPVQQLSSKQLEKLNALQISDAVKFFSGVSVKDYGGIGGLKTVSVRSLGANHTAVSYDGITLSDCQTGQIDIGRFSLENVDMLSLNNGQSDDIFQPARLFASAAILNIRTLSPHFEGTKKINGNITFKLGSFGLINPAFWLHTKLNQIYSTSLSAEWLTANGKYPYTLEYGQLATDSTSTETRKNTDVQNVRVEGALYANFSKKESGYVKAYLYNSQRGLPGATILYNTSNFSSQRMWDRTFFLQTHYKNVLSKTLAFQLNAKYNNGYLHYLDTTFLNSIGKMESFYIQNEYYGSLSIHYHTSKQLSFSFSSDGFINNMSANFESIELNKNFAYPTRYNLLTVVAAKYVSNQLLATASILSTVVNDVVQVGDAASRQNRLSPYLSFALKPFNTEDLHFRAFYKNIFRLPTFNDLYYSRIGNANLLPEITNQYNIGISYAKKIEQWLPLLTLTIDAYRNDVSNKIIAMPSKNIFIWSMVNLGKVQVTGLDMALETSIYPWKKFGLILGGTYTYQRALDVTNPSGNTYEHQIPYTPRISGSGKVGIETVWAELNYSFLWSGSRYAGFQNYTENRLPGYTDHSISISKVFKLNDKKISISIEMLNILNYNYAIIKWFPMPGRSVRASINCKF